MRYKEYDFDKLADDLDITPSMYDYAVARYQGISRYLSQCGIHAEFFPQGSFRTGTVVRPTKNGMEANFDIDIMCKISIPKDKTSPKEVKTSIGDSLKANAMYNDKLLPEDMRCWTLEYAGVSDSVGFNLDIVPSVAEDNFSILYLTNLGIPLDFAKDAVCITEKKSPNLYQWLPSNPQGFGAWFDTINKPFSDYNYKERKAKYFKNNVAKFPNFATIESVPDYHVKSSLQKVIQILKRHRDLFYHRAKKEGLQPTSIIITFLCAKSAVSAPFTLSTEALLGHIICDLLDYKSLANGQVPAVRYAGDERKAIEKVNGKWRITNPVDPKDNYADSWNDATAEAFFSWIDAVAEDLMNITTANESEYFSALRRSFGPAFVDKSLSLNSSNYIKTTPITTPTKPWSNIHD